MSLDVLGAQTGLSSYLASIRGDIRMFFPFYWDSLQGYPVTGDPMQNNRDVGPNQFTYLTIGPAADIPNFVKNLFTDRNQGGIRFFSSDQASTWPAGAQIFQGSHIFAAIVPPVHGAQQYRAFMRNHTGLFTRIDFRCENNGRRRVRMHLGSQLAINSPVGSPELWRFGELSIWDFWMGGSDSKIGLQGAELKRGNAGTRDFPEFFTNSFEGSTTNGVIRLVLVIDRGTEITGNEYDFLVSSLSKLFFIV